MTDEPRAAGIVPANRAIYRDEGELQSPNGRAGKFSEIGSSGIDAWSGYIREAYHSELQWPAVEPLFSRIRRSDPEMAIVRTIYTALGRDVGMEFELPEDAGDPEQQAVDFGNQVIDDIEGGSGKLIDTLLNHVPFMGWGWWEVVPGLRREGWRPPGQDDPWRSDYDDNRVGIRRLAWREHSSFHRWDLDDATGRLRGMEQLDPPNDPVTMPLERSLHVTFGDSNNPEGLSPLEAVWRLERLKYGLEVVQGIGFEHAAGHVMFKAEKDLTPQDKTEINKVARALLTAQEGNYAALPKGITGELIDVDFRAADSLLSAIKYYGLLKLQVYNMQWVALSTTSGTGSFAAMKDASSMFVLVFNSMLKGFAAQISEQLGRWLFRVNDFPGLEKRPELRITPVDKLIDLEELGKFLESFTAVSDLTDDDLIAIRRKSGFLPETLAEMDDDELPDEPESTGEPEPFPEPEEIETAVGQFRRWARKRAPGLARLLSRRVS
jgi:hypothetical protein